MMIVTMTMVVFLNFIIAEVGSSYNSVKDTINVSLMQERG